MKDPNQPQQRLHLLRSQFAPTLADEQLPFEVEEATSDVVPSTQPSSVTTPSIAAEEGPESTPTETPLVPIPTDESLQQSLSLVEVGPWPILIVSPSLPHFSVIVLPLSPLHKPAAK